uniref:Deleted in lung and esophageal cancer 1 n=1 Tax=Nothobranchius kadleci TaxID=1051664 RepID=A0A1A8CH83_NOTKA
MNDLDDRLTCESDSDTPKKKRTPKEKQNQTKPKPKWMCEPSVEERERLRKLKDRNDYLRNPRFLPPKSREGGSSLIRAKVKNKRSTKVSEDQSDDPAPVFIAKPSVIVFTDYIVGHIYESTLELINTTSTSCHVRVIPPNTQYFSIGLGRFPSEGGIVAPGLSCKYTVRFAPDSLGDYEDLLVVETHGKHLLKPGEDIFIELVFFPTAAERSSQTFTIVCDNCQVNDVSAEGEGQLVALELVSVSGEDEPLMLPPEPRESSVLKPVQVGSKLISVTAMEIEVKGPLFCQHFHSELMLIVENGTGCHVGVRADIQSPQVCLLNRKLVVSDHYIGVPAKCSVTLFNQTLLSSHFSWMAELRGQQAHLCTAIFDPPSGTLGPNETMEITVHFTPHSDVELTKVAAVCEVRGMNSPLVLAIAASKPKKLSVSYSLPGLCPSQSDTDPSALTLDFGEDVVLSKAATKQLLITNQSAIPAPFTLEAEYFSCHVSEPDNQSEKGSMQKHYGQVFDVVVIKTACVEFGADVRLDWKTYNIDQNDGKLVDVVLSYGDHFPLKDADGNEVMSGALGLSDEDAWTHAPLSDVTNVEEESSEPPPAGKNLISVHIRPHLGSLSDYPYCITPQQIVIPARSSRTIRVSFTPLTLSGSDCESRCAGFALGFMSLDSKTAVCVPGKVRRVQGLDLEPIRLDLQAAVKPAVLLVQMDEDGGVLGFNASAGDLLRAESDGKLVACEFDVTQSFQLVNPAEMPLRFRLGTKAPFSVLKPLRGSSSDPYTGDGQALVIQPRHSTRVKVAFHCSLPLLDHKNQTEDHKSAGVQLVHTENGWKKLRFQQNLLIQFSNNTQQTVPLCADLDLPTLSLSTDSLNFGFCCVGETRTTELNLYSDRARTFWNSHTESGVFRVSPDSGLLGSKKLHTTTYNQCLQISFTPSENREFKAMVVFQSPLVTTPLTLLLQGTGSLDEK